MRWLQTDSVVRSGRVLLRAALVLCALVAASTAAPAQAGKQEAKPPATAEKAPATPEAIQERIEEAEEEYRGAAPVPRIGFFDVAYPSDVDEYVELAGNAVAIVTVFVQDKDELPVKRAYLNLPGGGEVELKFITSVQSRQAEAGAKAAKTFGAHRLDALYLLPLHLNFREASLMVDFNKARHGLRLGSIHGSTFVLKDKLPDKTLADAPSEPALRQFIEREYPGFLKK